MSACNHGAVRATPSISVALATRNGAAFLRTQLESILAQTLPVDEIIIGDDDSRDATLQIARATLPADGPRLVIREHRPALGVAANFQDAIAHTTGEVIALCDQDDRWHPERLQRQVPQLRHADLVCSDARLVDAAGAPLGTLLSEAIALTSAERSALEGGDAFTALARRSLVTGATAVVDGAFARSAPPIGSAWIHDEWLAIMAAMRGGVRWLPQPLIDYRQHGSNVLGARRLTFAERLASVLHSDPALREREAARAASLAAAAQRHGLGTPAQRSLLAERAAFQQFRAELPQQRSARAPAVVRQWLRGRYALHSTGAAMALRDLLTGPAGSQEPDGPKH